MKNVLSSTFFLTEVHNGSVKSFIAALADGTGMSEEEIAEIHRWFREKAGVEQ